MDQSEAFKAARAKWANSAPNVEQASTANPLVTQQVASTPAPSGTIAVNGGNDFSRMARAMEAIADHMPGILAALTASGVSAASVVAPGLSAPVQSPGLSASDVAPGPSAAGSAVQVTNAEASAKQATGAGVGPVLEPSQEAGGYEEPNDEFDYGLGQLFGESDDDIDPQERCGVCKGKCSKLTLALDCGHYPFCSTCVGAMSKKSVSVNYKFQCPYCKAEVKETLVVRVD
ncbi:Postreplication repair E3 ubiquitin-protein ligase RAD18 [Frankliniella fusca]|uniref:Postreplication repair E3 ubiquitin-protein ligase RAD18 n=1 Tax=Frankliniella fusca TaxID=407009 RepID=A0AAE1HFR9_9NEOP|nr:Postreplication repair E3 ubiquitin-protein ligase RAD18 [Frankliniella fusca]